MANKRQLKRTINCAAGDLFLECVALRHFQTTCDDDVDNVMLAILHMQDDLICRVSHPEPGMPAKLFYKKLREDFVAQVAAIAEQIENAI